MDRLSSIAERVAMANVLYHGTSNENKGLSVIRDGHIKSEDLAVKRHGYLAPVAGRVYLAQNLRYAVIYTIGGDVIGSDVPSLWLEKERYGYLFVFNAADLTDVQPDEDSIGSLICDGYNIDSVYYKNKSIPSWLMEMADRHLTPIQKSKVRGGEYIYFAMVGKKLVKLMTQEQKRQIIDQHGAHIAAAGEIPFKEAWRFDKADCASLHRDASNFFQLAKRVT